MEYLADDYSALVNGAVLTMERRRLIFRSHGVETATAEGGCLVIKDQWLDTATGTWHSAWQDVSGWSAERILDFLGY